ncbi:MAG: hypothetical protein JXQ73_03010 [Phycisphaerae bacterium]|nr:hypothetical protein [Phycisphaerae bacterium]
MQMHRAIQGGLGSVFVWLCCAGSVCGASADSQPAGKSRSWPIVLPVVHVADPPKVDGKLDDEAWKGVAPVTNFVNLVTGEPARGQTEVRAIFDAETLYVGVVCHEQDMSGVISLATTRDGQVYRDNSVELFLTPNRSPGPYAHLAVNSIGTQFDEWVKGDAHDTSWNPAWTAKVDLQKNAWTVEMAIPFKSLNIDPPMPGRRWLANVTRISGPTGEMTTLARLDGGFHRPDEFVRMLYCFGPNEARVRIKYSPCATAQPAPPEPAAPPIGAELPVPALKYDRALAKVTLDDRGWLNVDGKPFFPRMLFLNQGYDGIKAAGFNVIVTGNDAPDAKGEWIGKNLEILEAAKKNGLWVVFHVCNLFRKDQARFAELRQMVLALKDHPALLGWYTADEPSGNVTHPIKLRTAYQLIKKIDPDHPVFVLEMSPAFFAYWARGTCDVFMADPYVVPLPGAEQVGAWTEQAGKAIVKGQALMICLQAQGPPWFSRYPTPAESRAMAWLAVIHGATGLGWWAHGPAKSSPSWGTYPAITAEAASLVFGLREASKREVRVDKGVHQVSFTVGSAAYVASVDCAKEAFPTAVTTAGEKPAPATLPAPPTIDPKGSPAPPPPPAPTPPPPAPAPAPTPAPAPATKPAPAPTPPAPTPPPPAPTPAPTPAPAPATKPAPAPTPPAPTPPPPAPAPAPTPAPAPATKPAPAPTPPAPTPPPPAPTPAPTAAPAPATKPAPAPTPPAPTPPPPAPAPAPTPAPAPATKPAPAPTPPAPTPPPPAPAPAPAPTTKPAPAPTPPAPTPPPPAPAPAPKPAPAPTPPAAPPASKPASQPTTAPASAPAK